MGEEINFKLRGVEQKPLKRYMRGFTRERRRAYDKNIQGDGVYAKILVHAMLPDVERLIREGKISLIEIAWPGIFIILKDGTRLRLK